MAFRTDENPPPVDALLERPANQVRMYVVLELKADIFGDVLGVKQGKLASPFVDLAQEDTTLALRGDRILYGVAPHLLPICRKRAAVSQPDD